MSNIQEKLKNLPQSPGVYIFKAKYREIIYIGKAASLRSRVGSYFSDLKRFDLSRPKRPKKVEPLFYSRPIEAMIHRVADIETRETDSVLEALILESHLIKKYQPKYNAMGKDDKSFAYFVITKEEFPRIVILRKTGLDKAQISKRKTQIQNLKLKTKKIHNTLYKIQFTNAYGPYISKKQMEIALKIIRKIFPFHSLAQHSEKVCLDFQSGLARDRTPGRFQGKIISKISGE